jgi:hypothetical protein
MIQTKVSDPNPNVPQPVPVFSLLENIDISASSWNITIAATGDVYARVALYVTGPHLNLSTEKFLNYRYIWNHSINALASVNLWPVIAALKNWAPKEGEYYTLFALRVNVRAGFVSPLSRNQVIVQA